MRSVLAEPMHLTSEVVSNRFKDVTQSARDYNLADQFRSWFETKSPAAKKHVDTSPTVDAKAS